MAAIKEYKYGGGRGYAEYPTTHRVIIETIEVAGHKIQFRYYDRISDQTRSMDVWSIGTPDMEHHPFDYARLRRALDGKNPFRRFVIYTTAIWNDYDDSCEWVGKRIGFTVTFHPDEETRDKEYFEKIAQEMVLCNVFLAIGRAFGTNVMFRRIISKIYVSPTPMLVCSLDAKEPGKEAERLIREGGGYLKEENEVKIDELADGSFQAVYVVEKTEAHAIAMLFAERTGGGTF